MRFAFGSHFRKFFSSALPVIIAVFLVFHTACQNRTTKSARMNEFPPVILWAWERPENLDFIDTKKYGVAFLAQTLELNGDSVIVRPRRQPLSVPPGAKIIAVTRIETVKNSQPALSDGQKRKAIAAVLKTLEAENVRAVQIDFDAAVSEREFYREFLRELRTELPADFAITITALASFCICDAWIADLPADEAVPMIFRMGADDKNIREFLANGGDFNVPLCRTSYGIATDEPLKLNFVAGRRIYVFNAKPWRAEDLKFLPEAARP